MSGELRLANSSNNGRSSLVSNATQDVTFRLPNTGSDANAIILTDDAHEITSINWDGIDVTLVNGDFRVDGDSVNGLLFVDESADRVGIGTTTPTEKLAVSNGNIGIVQNSGKIGFNLSDEYSSGLAQYGLTKLPGSTPVNLSGFFGITFGTNSAQRVTITQNGNVGINVTNPTQRLAVEGNVEVPNGYVQTGDDDTSDPNTDGAVIYSGGLLVVKRQQSASASAKSIRSYYGTNETFYVTAEGDIDLDGGVSADKQFLTRNGYGVADNSVFGLVIQGSDSTANATIRYDGQLNCGSFPTGNGINADVLNGCYSVRNDNAGASDGTNQAIRVYTGGQNQPDISSLITAGGSARFDQELKAGLALKLASNAINGASTSAVAIQAISTDGGVNTPTVYCDNRYGAGNYVLLAAFNPAGDAIAANTSVGPGGTFIVLITSNANNFPTLI